MHSTNFNLFSNNLETKDKKNNYKLTISVPNDNFPTSSTMYQPINETLMEKRLPKNDNLLNKIQCVLPNNYSNINDSTVSSSESKTLTSELINNLENFATIQSSKQSDCLNLEKQSYSSFLDNNTNSMLTIENQQKNINNDNNNNEILILSTEKTMDNLSIQTPNSNYLQNSLASNSSLLSALLSTTRQSPTVPESRTEQQSGLVNNINYESKNNNSNNLFLSNQLSLNVQEYILKQNNQLEKQCKINDLLQSVLTSSTCKQVSF